MGDRLQRDVPVPPPSPALTPQDNTFPLFKRMVKPGFENLFFLGLAQPLPTLVNFAEQQSKLVAAAIAGTYAFPATPTMDEVTAADEKEHLGHFYDSPRHRMQVDFNVYVADSTRRSRPARSGRPGRRCGRRQPLGRLRAAARPISPRRADGLQWS